MAVVLAVASWKVYEVRAELAREDADPAAVSRLQERLSRIPLVIEGGYRGKPHPMSLETARQAGADTFASIDYDDARGNRFQLYVGGAVRNQENFHAPSYCMPATGWELLEESTVPFAYPVRQEGARMRRLLLQYGNNRMVVYYWFRAGGAIADHEFVVRWYRFLDLLAGRPLAPTLIMTVYAPVPEDLPRTERELRSFLGAIGPTLERVLEEGT
jgi:EpsI family protein